MTAGEGEVGAGRRELAEAVEVLATGPGPVDLSDAVPAAARDLLADGGRPDRPDPSDPVAPDLPGLPRVDLQPALEAVLMVADQPLDHLTLAAAVGYPADQVSAALEALAADYTEQDRGFDLRNVAGGWRYYTREEYAGVVERFVLERQQARLTQAALETLAVVAYKQPVSRGRVSAVRGVNVDGVMRTLLSRGLVEEAGQDTETAAVLYRTTGYFLERIGIGSLDDLPDLAPFLPAMADLDDPDDSSTPVSSDPVNESGGASSRDASGDATGDESSTGS